MATLKTNGIDTHYVIEGDGPLVTMGHSLACNLAMWDEQARVLAGRGYRVLRYDTRGHGKSSAPAGAYTLEQMAGDLLGLLDGLGIKQTHFVGLSMGGMIGQVFTLEHPERIQSLVPCDTTSRYPAEAAKLWEERIAIATGKGMEPLVTGTLERWFTAPFRETNKPVVERVATMIRTTPAAGYAGCCHAIPKIDVTDRLGEIRCPALVICGEQDPGTPVAMARDIANGIRGAELCIIPSAAHLSNLEQPQKFNDALLGFLDRVAKR